MVNRFLPYRILANPRISLLGNPSRRCLSGLLSSAAVLSKSRQRLWKKRATMGMGRRKAERPDELSVSRQKPALVPRPVFYEQLNRRLAVAGFDEKSRRE